MRGREQIQHNTNEKRQEIIPYYLLLIIPIKIINFIIIFIILPHTIHMLHSLSLSFMHTALGKMEEILLEMKQDIGKLSMELTRCPSVSQQLKIDELSILSKLASRDRLNGTAGANKTAEVGSTTHQSVITSASQNGTAKVKPVPVATTESVPAPIKLQPEVVTIPKVATQGVGQTLQGVGQTFSVPRFVEGATVLVPAHSVGGASQALPVVSGQQVVYWASTQAPTILTPVGGVQYAVSRAPPTSSNVSGQKKKVIS